MKFNVELSDELNSLQGEGSLPTYKTPVSAKNDYLTCFQSIERVTYSYLLVTIYMGSRNNLRRVDHQSNGANPLHLALRAKASLHHH